ncbi:ATPase P-type K/Mg/Cd/Cu/Zn/Na/Ca/Na/H-transporter [Penicillium canariense]|uniref:Calcium-transporting ATPase n=1 Tax=Penicillium canariense TaxID=189055 RepID=A0A9W9I486_9EURO|nr:ATPase P-type K/Mg/Cd/Cu/Zn/Na/Ca/Na/H-transporter [Penicillium canariense]KAJ5166831.1 ATPase P-type K/Mg/Cd/Cu/Zn/Na/Ca/Na/H-transporter [Penicillium canariense]
MENNHWCYWLPLAANGISPVEAAVDLQRGRNEVGTVERWKEGESSGKHNIVWRWRAFALHAVTPLDHPRHTSISPLLRPALRDFSPFYLDSLPITLSRLSFGAPWDWYWPNSFIANWPRISEIGHPHASTLNLKPASDGLSIHASTVKLVNVLLAGTTLGSTQPFTMSDPQREGEEPAQTPTTPLRRERAPTITIDTSAVNSPDSTRSAVQILSGPVQPSLHLATDTIESHDSGAHYNGSGSPTDMRSPASLRSNASSEARDRESRPTSPHNISSPKSKVPEAHSHFLSVPGTRSRGNSLESEDTSQTSSTYGGDTFVPAASHGSNVDLIKNANNSDDEDALTPDPGREDEFEVENNKFAFSPGQLNKLLNPKSFGAFRQLGGLRGLEKGLRTDVRSGLSVDESTLEGGVEFADATTTESMPKSASPTGPTPATTEGGETKSESDESFVDRKRVYGVNKLPERKLKTIWELAWIAYNDKVLILLTIAAAVSLAVGIPQSLHPADPNEPGVEWVEGLAILVAIIIVVTVGAANDWQKERQFAKLNKKKENRLVQVIRSGKTIEISIHDVLVGDVMHLEPGDMVPVDGILIDGHDVKCDESSATGESDLLRKTPGDEVYRTLVQHEDLRKMDPFIVSGAKVSEGVGTFLVTAVGVHTTHGRTMMSLQEEGETTPLQTKLNKLAEYIAKLGLAAGLLLFVVLFIKFLVRLKDMDGGADTKGQAFLQIFIVAVTIVVVAVPEGLPLAVTLALAFATTRMIKDNNLVRFLKACETMGNATTICSDKTGTLTLNKMSVVSATLGTTSRFGDKSGSDQSEDPSASEFVSALSPSVKDLLLQSIVLNSTAFEGEQEGVKTFIGSKTETALLSFARDYLGMGAPAEARANAKLAQMFPFDSARKCMAVVAQMENGKYRMLVKGAAEILMNKSTRIIRDPTDALAEAPLSDEDRSTLDNTIVSYASRSLRCIALVYREFDQWPPRGAPTSESDRSQAVFEPLFKDMTVLGLVGIQDPVRPGVAEAVHTCQRAGVFVRMVTGDNILTAKAIAEECGIYTPGGIAIEGPKFRKLSTRQMNQILPRLQVIGRSSPEDKKILVNALKKLGETVAVTGDGTNDAQALKNADVGFAMGVTGTEVAKEASDIILMDDNFASIVKAMAWGRTVSDAVKKFLQFQITVNITAVILTFVSAVASSTEDSVLSAVQLLWVNLIMDTFAALALATDPPSPYVLDRRPESKASPLITTTMWKMIIGQSIYQLVVTFVLNFAGKSIFPWDDGHMQTVVFNTFVFMQIFNQYNSRRIDNKLNIMEGIWRNKWFIGIQVIIIGGQVLIIFIGGAAFSVKRLDQGSQWAVSLVLGALSVPIAVVIRLIPDEFASKLVPHFWYPRQHKKGPELVVSDEDRRYEWNPALEEIRDQLQFLKAVRGGRLRHLRHKLQNPQEFLPRSRSGSRSRESSAPPTPNGDNGSPPPGPSTPESRSRRNTRSRSNSTFGPAAAMAGIVAGSIAGWSPIERNHDEADSIMFSTSAVHGGLDQQQGIEIHPDTAPDDRVVSEYSANSKTPPSQNPDLIPFFEHAPPATATTERAPSSRSRRSLSQRSRSSQSHSQV